MNLHSTATAGSPLAAHPALRALRTRHSALTALRHRLHAIPELGFEEHATAALVRAELESSGVDAIHTGIGRTGLVAVVHGQRTDSGRTIGLRADMDALPLQEENDFAHRSGTPGRMHACGHDGHTTMLLGAARELAATRRFNGTVHLIFQPGEEGYAGAREMIRDGLFQRFPCDQVFALHNWPGLPAGHVGISPGPAMAAADRITIRITGVGGHGAHPHTAVDPVVVAAHLIVAAQTIVSRNVSPIDQAVVSLCAVQAGDPGAMSVIPDHATLTGTVRTFSERVQQLIESRLQTLCDTLPSAFGAQAQLTYERLYPAVVNHPDPAEFGAETARELFGADRVNAELPPSMGAEDFAFMLQQCPGAYFRLGQAGGPSGCFLHNPRYDFNDAIIPDGGALFVRLAERAMPL